MGTSPPEIKMLYRYFVLALCLARVVCFAVLKELELGTEDIFSGVQGLVDSFHEVSTMIPEWNALSHNQERLIAAAAECYEVCEWYCRERSGNDEVCECWEIYC